MHTCEQRCSPESAVCAADAMRRLNLSARVDSGAGDGARGAISSGGARRAADGEDREHRLAFMVAVSIF